MSKDLHFRHSTSHHVPNFSSFARFRSHIFTSLISCHTFYFAFSHVIILSRDKFHLCYHPTMSRFSIQLLHIYHINTLPFHTRSISLSVILPNSHCPHLSYYHPFSRITCFLFHFAQTHISHSQVVPQITPYYHTLSDDLSNIIIWVRVRWHANIEGSCYFDIQITNTFRVLAQASKSTPDHPYQVESGHSYR